MKGLKSGLRLKSEPLGSNIVNILLSLWTQTQGISQTGSIEIWLSHGLNFEPTKEVSQILSPKFVIQYLCIKQYNLHENEFVES